MAVSAGQRRRRRDGLLRRPVLWIIAIAVLAAVVVLTLSSSARAGANDFLLAFRVQPKARTLAIIVAPVPAQTTAQPLPGAAALLNTAQLQLTGGQPVAVLDDAQALVSFSIVRLGRFPRPSQITVYQDGAARIIPNPAALEALLQGITGQRVQLPAELAATQISAQFHEAVRQRWDTQGIALTYWQSDAPVLQTTAGLPIDQLRNQILQAYFLVNPSVGQQLLSVQDWNYTVVLPVPPGAKQQQVQIDHQPATLIESRGSNGPDSFLVWQKLGILNYLHAPISGAQLLSYGSRVGTD